MQCWKSSNKIKRSCECRSSCYDGAMHWSKTSSYHFCCHYYYDYYYLLYKSELFFINFHFLFLYPPLILYFDKVFWMLKPKSFRFLLLFSMSYFDLSYSNPLLAICLWVLKETPAGPMRTVLSFTFCLFSFAIF